MAEWMIATSDEYSDDRFRLLELNANVEKEILAGKRVFIVGEPDQQAVLCTTTQSYLLQKEDTSNLRLLTTHTQWGAKSDEESTTNEDDDNDGTVIVHGSALSHYLLQPRKADMAKLKSLLLEQPYTASQPDENKRMKAGKLYDTADLVSAIQASEHEVEELLEQLCAFQDAGKWRVLNPSYQTQVFGDILDAIVQKDLDFLNEGIPLQRLVTEVDAPQVVVRQCCRIYGSVSSSGSDSVCKLDAKKIAIFVAKQLLDESALDESTRDGWLLDQFMDKWQLRVPEHVTVDATMLRGVALLRAQKGKPARLVYYPEDALPADPKARFQALFQMQDKWTVDQLEPYIEAIVGDGVTQAALLLKHTRASRQAGSTQKLYSKR